MSVENRTIKGTDFHINDSYLEMRGRERSWKPRKTCSIRTSLAKTSIVNLNNVSELTPELFLKFFEKINPKGDKEIYFDLSKSLGTEKDQQEFSKKCERKEKKITYLNPQ